MGSIQKFLVALDAVPGPAVHFASPKPIRGYCQTLGVSVSDAAELRRQVQEFISADVGGTLNEIYEVWVPDFDGRDRDIKELCTDTEAPGVWYASGRAWYWDEEEESEQ